MRTQADMAADIASLLESLRDVSVSAEEFFETEDLPMLMEQIEEVGYLHNQLFSTVYDYTKAKGAEDKPAHEEEVCQICGGARTVVVWCETGEVTRPCPRCGGEVLE